MPLKQLGLYSEYFTTSRELVALKNIVLKSTITKRGEAHARERQHLDERSVSGRRGVSLMYPFEEILYLEELTASAWGRAGSVLGEWVHAHITLYEVAGVSYHQSQECPYLQKEIVSGGVIHEHETTPWRMGLDLFEEAGHEGFCKACVPQADLYTKLGPISSTLHLSTNTHAVPYNKKDTLQDIIWGVQGILDHKDHVEKLCALVDEYSLADTHAATLKYLRVYGEWGIATYQEAVVQESFREQSQKSAEMLISLSHGSTWEKVVANWEKRVEKAGDGHSIPWKRRALKDSLAHSGDASFLVDLQDIRALPSGLNTEVLRGYREAAFVVYGVHRDGMWSGSLPGVVRKLVALPREYFQS